MITTCKIAGDIILNLELVRIVPFTVCKFVELQFFTLRRRGC